MSAGPNARRTLHGLLADGAGLIWDIHVGLCGCPNLIDSGNDGDGVKEVPRRVKGGRGDGNGDRHVRHWTGPHILTKEEQGQVRIALVGCDHVRPVLSVQKADDTIELTLCVKHLGQDVQNIAVFVHCRLYETGAKTLTCIQ